MSERSLREDYPRKDTMSMMRLTLWLHMLISLVGCDPIDLDNLVLKGGEYCNHETFKARCPSDHVIQMINASMGRMRIGGCVKEAPNPDCDVNALPVLHRNCSGVSRCTIDVSTIDKLMMNLTSVTCSKEYRLYLEAYYRCVPVETEAGQVCQSSITNTGMTQFPIHVEDSEGYLASITTRTTGKGSERCPWHIRGRPGQTIHISLLETHSPVKAGDGVCQIYAYIKDSSVAGGNSKLMDCGYDTHGQLFSSLTESVDITIVDTVEDRNFVLHFQAVGCPDIIPRGGADVLRKGNRTYVTCDEAMWQLECLGDEWIGDMGDCNMPAVDRAGPLIPWPKSWGQELTIVMIISVAVVIAVMIVVVGVCIVRRRVANHFMPVSQSGEYGVYGLQGPVAPSKCYYPTLPPGVGNSCGASGSESSHYTTTIDRRQAIPPPNGAISPGDNTYPRSRTLFLQQHDVTSCASCPVQHVCEYPGNYNDHVGASGWQTFPIRRPDHIYASPKFDKRDGRQLPYYHELDPQEVERQLRVQQERSRFFRQRPPPSIPVPPIPQLTEDEEGLESDDTHETFPPPPSPSPPPLPPDHPNQPISQT